jgi:hypothetical protein
MTNAKPVKDALGNEIVMGQDYGYAAANSGWTRVVTGMAESVTKTGKVTLRVKSLNTYLYGETSDYVRANPSDKISVKGCILFPVVTQL